MKNKVNKLDIIVISITVIYFFLFFGRVLFSGQSFIFGDFYNIYYPMKYHLAYWLRQWIVPFWIPHLYGGQPFLAELQPAVYYLPSVILAFFDKGMGINYFVCLHYLLGIAWFFMLMRYWGVSTIGSVFSTIVFVFNGCMVSLHSIMDSLQAIIWLPILFICVEKVLETPRIIPTIFFAVIFAMQLLSGGIQYALISISLLILYVFIIGIIHNGKWIKSFLLILGGAGVGSLLAACQLLPSTEMMMYSSRLHGLNTVEDYNSSLSLVNYVSTILANMYFDPATQTSWVHVFNDPRKFLIPSIYVGILPVIFAVFSFWGKNRPKYFLFWGFGIFALVMSLGDATPVYPWLHDHVPLFKPFRYPEKWAIFFVFCVSVLAGLGWHKLGDKSVELSNLSGPRFFLFASVILVVVVTCIILIVLPIGVKFFLFKIHQLDPSNITIQAFSRYQFELQVSVYYMLVALILFMLMMLFPKRKEFTSIVMLLFICIDYYRANQSLLPTVESSFYTDPPVIVQQLRQDNSMYRISHLPVTQVITTMIAGRRVDRVYLANNIGMIYGIDYAAGLIPLRTLEIVEFLTAMRDAPLEIQLKKLDLLNVKYVISQNQVYLDNYLEFGSLNDSPPFIYKNETCFPRFWFVDKIVELENKKDFFTKLKQQDTDFSRQAFSRQDDPFRLQPTLNILNISTNELQVLEVVKAYYPDCNRVKLLSNSTKTRYIIGSETYFPGWIAYSGGANVKTGRVNHFMKGLIVGPGENDIDLVYEPFSARLGLYVSLAMVFIIVFILFAKIPGI